MCCCGPGHRCPQAWQLIRLAQRARERGEVDTLDEVRLTYSMHLGQAGLRVYPAIAHPDVCTITIDDDPRCPQCASFPDTERSIPRSQICAWCGHLNDETARWCPRCSHAAHLPRARYNCLWCQSRVT